MASCVVFWAFLAQVFGHTCLGAPFTKPGEGDIETLQTDTLPLSEVYDLPAEIFEEYDHWDEWDDYEEDPGNKCNLTSFEPNNRASYLCQDGTAWSVNIQQTDEKCIYSRNVQAPTGEKEIKKAAVSCDVLQEWLEDLVQYEVYSGIPDMFLYNSRKSDSVNTENIPVIYEPPPPPLLNK